MSDLDDGETYHHGPAEAGRGHHGGKNYQSYHNFQKLSPYNARICVFEGGSYGHHSRRYNWKLIII